MSFDFPDFKRPKRSKFTTFVLVAIVLAFLVSISSGFWVQFAWFKSVDFTNVLVRQLTTQALLFAIFFVTSFIVVRLAAEVAYRARPEFFPRTPEEHIVAKYREGLESVRKVVFTVGPLIFALLTGLAGSSMWQEFLQWRNAVPFGQTDAQFGKDISFFTFKLPFIEYLIGFGFTLLIVSFISNAVVHYFYGALRPSRLKQSTSAARRQLMVFLGLLTLLKAAAYTMDKYALAIKSDSLISGLRYTDIHALVPAKNILTYIAVATAILFFVSVFKEGWSLPFIAFGVMLFASVLIGGLYPAFVQQFQVKPSELARETPYISRNIEATRSAYDLNDISIKEYQAIDNPSQATLDQDAGTLKNVRLLDPNVTSPTFRNLQQIRSFYAFPDSLDIDRYTLNNKEQGTVLAAREMTLAGVSASQRNWFNDHMVFTHGYGVVAASDNAAKADGSPRFIESDVPPSGSLDIKQPRIYFGERSSQYSIVGTPAGTNDREFDYPDDKSANGQANNTYDGKGGVPVGNLVQRAILAVYYQDMNILLSNQMNSESKILFNRQPADRVAKVAPWVTLDNDPYPAVIDGRVVWILDGYTTSDAYPYSNRVSLSDVTADSVNTAEDNLGNYSVDDVTYIRNSVKATVDAYDGTVHVYAWDESDPVLKMWSKAFPGVVEPKSAIPAGMLSHVRYPEDLFKVQREVLSKYHVTDAQAFYSGQDFWNIPDDPTMPSVKQAQPAYYLNLQMPGEKTPSFSLTSTFAPNKRQTLAAFMAVNSEPGENFGKIQVLQLPRNTTIPGPTQVQNNFESDPVVSQSLSLLRKGGSDVTLGNLLSLPVGNGLLYVEPVYVRATSSNGYPLLRKVLVSFGSKVAFEDTLEAALNEVFGAGTSTPTQPTDPGTPSGGTSLEKLTAAIADANAAYEEGQSALAKGDFAAYGVAQKKLKAALKIMSSVGPDVTKSATKPSPSATP